MYLWVYKVLRTEVSLEETTDIEDWLDSTDWMSTISQH